MDNKDKGTPMDNEQIILKEKRAFELSLKTLTDDKKSLLAEIAAAEQELKVIDSKIHSSEQLIDELDDVTKKAAYFSDAEQLKSIKVKDAENLAATFNVLGRKAQTKKKELWAQLSSWHTSQSQKKEEIGQIIDGHKETIAELDQEINAKKKDFEEYVLNSSGDKAGKKRAKNVLDAANKDKKVLNSFNAPISILITSPSKEVQKIPFIFSFKKEGDIWKYVGTTNPTYDKKVIHSVSMKFSKNELTINKDFKLEWFIKFTSFEKTSTVAKKKSKTKEDEETKTTSHTETDHDTIEVAGEGNAKVDLLVVEFGGGGGVTWGDEDVVTDTEEKTKSKKKGETVGDERTKGFSQKFDIVSCEGTINYSATYLDNGEVKVKASGDHNKQQTIKDQKYIVQIDDSNFIAQFN